jgi:hypothetical protein
LAVEGESCVKTSVKNNEDANKGFQCFISLPTSLPSIFELRAKAFYPSSFNITVPARDIFV